MDTFLSMYFLTHIHAQPLRLPMSSKGGTPDEENTLSECVQLIRDIRQIPPNPTALEKAVIYLLKKEMNR